MTTEGRPLSRAAWGRAGRFRRPLYDTYNFARLPATLSRLLGRPEGTPLPADALDGLDAEYDTVVLLFIDAFGWRFFERYAEELPFLRRFRDNGRATPITSQFPSTTACHVTCIHTGVPVGVSGVYEWFYYEPRVGDVIAPLPFCFAGDHKRDTLAPTGLTPADIFPADTIYQRLNRGGVESFIFQHSDYTPSTYSDYFFRGARVVRPFKTLAEALTNLARTLAEPADGRKRYCFFYLDAIDHIGHKYGPDSEQFAAEVEATFTLLERFLYQRAAGRAGRALLTMTADHGMVRVDPKQTVYLNEQSRLPNIGRFFRRNGRDGGPIKFAGSCRDLFLHVRDEALGELEAALQELLQNRAEVWRVQALLDEGFFGPEVSETLRRRLGNLVVLPYEGESVYWREEGKFDMHFHGHHGGLTPGEMDTGFYAVPL